MRQTPDVIARLAANCSCMRGERDDDDLAGFIERDLAFHKAVDGGFAEQGSDRDLRYFLRFDRRDDRGREPTRNCPNPT
jgi:hypothetical protein